MEPEVTSFAELLHRLRCGDSDAAAELFHRYGPDLRVMARIRLRIAGIQQYVESMDICQSVFCNFFLRLACGDFELNSSRDILKLLTVMICNKVSDVARHHRAGKRSTLQRAVSLDETEVIDPADNPAEIASIKELWRKFEEALSPDELHLWTLRRQGKTWEQIAAETGRAPDTLRKFMTRAASRVAPQVGLVDADP